MKKNKLPALLIGTVLEFILLTLQGCGQTGALYLPPNPKVMPLAVTQTPEILNEDDDDQSPALETENPPYYLGSPSFFSTITSLTTTSSAGTSS